jgi:hypothetical protein
MSKIFTRSWWAGLLALSVIVPSVATAQPSDRDSFVVGEPTDIASGSERKEDEIYKDLVYLTTRSSLIVKGRLFQYSKTSGLCNLSVEQVIHGKFEKKTLPFICGRAIITLEDNPYELQGERLVEKKILTSRIWFFRKISIKKRPFWELIVGAQGSSLSEDMQEDVLRVLQEERIKVLR